MSKKKKGQLVEMTKREAIKTDLTQEEIEAVMRRDEAELEGHLNKFAKLPQPDASGVKEEEDAEEETITLDFEEDGIKAYEKVAEGVLARGADGELVEVDEATAERVKEILEAEAPKKPEYAKRYEDMIRDRFVSKAIASLMEKLNDAASDMEKAIGGILGSTGVGNQLNEETYKLIQTRKDELRKAWSWNGTVQYEYIPDWALESIDEYIRDGLNSLLDFVERD